MFGVNKAVICGMCLDLILSVISSFKLCTFREIKSISDVLFIASCHMSYNFTLTHY